VFAGNGGAGNYGGGGGGGSKGGGNGGRGGFGGGGGAGWADNSFGSGGGNGGFGAGGGAGPGGFVCCGDPGDGGEFGGDGNSRNGGGGGALGGAIFSDTGTVVVKNSTFTGNVVRRGLGGAAGRSGAAADGRDGGAAIFSLNGSLTVLNATISGNQGLSGVGGAIYVKQTNQSYPTSFVLENSILANNGPAECSIVGFVVAGTFSGNLIRNNDNCPGVVTTADPLLGPLQKNGGPTPTMAIGRTSPAFNAADSGTSPPVDQRGQVRPEMGGDDIGAFELCLLGFGFFQFPCPIIAGVLPDQQVSLTIDVSPAGGGVTVPPAGTSTEILNSVVALKATPNAGYRFTTWSPNVTGPTSPSTTVVMNQSQAVTASFVVCDCAVDVTGSIAIGHGGFTLNPITKRYVQTVTLTNTSAAPVTGPISLVIDGLSSNATVFNPTGITSLMVPAGSPYVNAGTTTLAAGQSVSITLQFTNPSNTAISYTGRVLAGPGAR
jgi:hypothetical protein